MEFNFLHVFILFYFILVFLLHKPKNNNLATRDSCGEALPGERRRSKQQVNYTGHFYYITYLHDLFIYLFKKKKNLYII